MKRFLLAALLTIATAGALAQVGVSVSIGQPGFYGHLDIGGFPPPALIYPQPLVIGPAPVGVAYAPIYLRVPPGHSRHWAKHCHRYNACGRPVYFVRDNWYNTVYVPRYRARHGYSGHRYEAPRPSHYRPGPGYAPGPRPVYAPGHSSGPGRGHGQGHGQGHGKGHGQGWQ